MDENDDLKKRFAISPLFDAEIDVAGCGLVALSPEVDHDLRTKVTAALISHIQGYSSVDYVSKKYMKTIPEHTSRDETIKTVVDDHIFAYDQFYRSFPPRSGENIGVFAFDLAFVRSYETIRLLYITARQGFLLEPCLIARSLIEQFAYAVSVWGTDLDDIVFKTKPQSSISRLKSVQPNIGKAYGLLSESSHYHPDMHFSFIDSPDEFEELSNSKVLQRTWIFKIYSVGWLLFILDLQFRVFSFCYGTHANFSIVEGLRGAAKNAFDETFECVPPETMKFIRELF